MPSLPGPGYLMAKEDVTRLVQANADLARQRDLAREANATLRDELETLAGRAHRLETEAEVLYGMLQYVQGAAREQVAITTAQVARADVLRKERFGV